MDLVVKLKKVKVDVLKPDMPDLKEKMAQADLFYASSRLVGPIQIAAWKEGSESPTIYIRIDTLDGRTVLAETTWPLFYAAAMALREHLGEPT